MWKTTVILIFTLVVVPVFSFYFDDPLSANQQDVLYLLLRIYFLMALLTFVVSTFSCNFSQVDKLWSIMPILYSWIVAYHASFEPRMVLMASLVSLWGIRLSYNFARRGGYSWAFWRGEEDYRWAILRSKPEFNNALKWGAFNLFFISLYQMGLILLFTLPILKSMGGKPLGMWDAAITVLFIGFLLLETIADQQQWNYHREKNRRKRNGEELGTKYNRGFVKEGLWAWMRHPNYMAEQAIWVCFYLFSISATGHWFNWSISGCLLLLVLFRGSSDFSEKISASKYPEYENYRNSTGRFLPGTGRKSQ